MDVQLHVSMCDPASTCACLCVYMHVCLHVSALWMQAYGAGACCECMRVCVCVRGSAWVIRAAGRWIVEVEKNAQGKSGREGGRRRKCSLLLLSPLLKRNNIPSRRQKGNKSSGSTIYDANWDSIDGSNSIPRASRSTSQQCPGFQRAPPCPPINQPVAENAPMSSTLETSLISRDRLNGEEFQDKGRKAGEKNIYIHKCACLYMGYSLLYILAHLLQRSYRSVSIHFPCILHYMRNFSGFRSSPDGIRAIVLPSRLWEINEVRKQSHEKIEMFKKKKSAPFPKIQQPQSHWERSV